MAVILEGEMADLLPYGEGLFAPANSSWVGPVYLVSGPAEIEPNDWITLSLTGEMLILSDRHRVSFPICLLDIRNCRVDKLEGVTITMPSDFGLQVVAPILMYAVIVSYIHMAGIVGDERELALYVGYWDIAERWKSEINRARDLCHLALHQRTMPRPRGCIQDL
jgi:hypothetical protein